MRPAQHACSRFGLMIIVVSSLLAVTLSAHAQSYSPYAYVEPPYSSFVVGYAQLPFDDYSNTASDINFRFEQRLNATTYISGQYFDFSEPQNDFSYASELEDMQFGIGYMERSDLGPHTDLSLLVGRETFQRPLQDDPTAALIDKSNYLGFQLGLREAHGPLELQAAVAYLFHDGDRDDQLRWHIGAFYTVWKTFSVGLRYQDNDDYSVRSIELRYTW